MYRGEKKIFNRDNLQVERNIGRALHVYITEENGMECGFLHARVYVGSVKLDDKSVGK